jgi:hypothetical protein
LATRFDSAFFISAAEKTRTMYVSFFEGVSAAKKINVVDGRAREHLPGASSKFFLWFSLALAVDVLLHLRGRLAEGPGDTGSPDESLSESSAKYRKNLEGLFCLFN